MKKVALVFVVAVLLPSLVLAWLAVRSLRDQQFLLERQQSLLDQRVTDALAQNISDFLAQRQQEFSAQVETLAADKDAREVAAQFDEQLRRNWPLAEVGFCVTLEGKILSPPPNARPEAQMFRLNNGDFLGNLEPVEVYWNANYANGNNASSLARNSPSQPSSGLNAPVANNLPVSPQTMVGGAVEQNQAQQSIAFSAPAAAPPQEKMAASDSDKNAGQNFTRAGQGQSLAASSSLSSRAGGFGGGGGGGLGGRGSGQGEQKQLQQTPALAASTAQASPPQELLLAKEQSDALAPAAREPAALDNSAALKDDSGPQPSQNAFNYKAAQARKVSPQSQQFQLSEKADAFAAESQNNLSRVIPAEAEFRQLVGDQSDGMIARFLQNKLNLMFWHRLSRKPDFIFGAQVNLNRLVNDLRPLILPDRELRDEICVMLLDDNAKPVAESVNPTPPNFRVDLKHPFVATEVGEALPHWEVAAYLLNPNRLPEAARTAELTLGLLIAVLVFAIGVGSWLIVSSLNAELKLARQKTDFVSNVSHELKTPLTSIRMFSELLADGRVADSAKQKSYLQIITAEAARLTRLINNVLDFSRMENGDKKYNFAPCDLKEIVRSTAETFRPHLEANGFTFDCELVENQISIRGDADALSQIIVNLLSNAEKYSDGKKEITLQLSQKQSPLLHAEIKVLDRGSGVPRGSEEKVFEKFYRAHDSLSSGIQGSGLGLTIARQIARAHGGDVAYEPHEGGGSCFVLRLPIKP